VTGATKYAFAQRIEDLVTAMRGRVAEVEAEPMAAIIFSLEAHRLLDMLPILLKEHKLLLGQVERDVHQCGAHHLSCEKRREPYHEEHWDSSGTTWSHDPRGGISITWGH
jgi:hypothetical protein